MENTALDLAADEAQVALSGDPSQAFVGLAFKLEEGKFGQLTYMRLYQGTINRGDSITSMANKSKARLPPGSPPASPEVASASKVAILFVL